ESDEGTKREVQKHAIAPGYARAPQNEPPALPPPCPALGSVHDAQGHAGSSGSLMHARVSFGRKSRIRPEGRCLVLRTHELGFVGERELAKVRERAQLVGGHARFTPLPGVKAVDRKSTRLNSSHQIISYAV